MVFFDCWGHTEVVCHTLEVCTAWLSCVDGLWLYIKMEHITRDAPNTNW
jgi:hypothetical protein